MNQPGTVNTPSARSRRPAYAGLVSRAAGLVVDGALLTVLTSLILNGIPQIWGTVATDPPGWLLAGVEAVSVVLPVGYFATFWWLNGQTFGSMLFGTVVRRDPDGSVSFPRALARALLGVLLAPVWLIGMISTVWEPRRRAWHDRIFGTVVRYRQAGRRSGRHRRG